MLLDWQRIGVAVALALAAILPEINIAIRITLGVLVIAVIMWPMLERFWRHSPDGRVPRDELPDWPISELFTHIDPDVLDGDPNANRWEQVGQQIRDALGLGQLKSWGRPLAAGRDSHDKQTPIPPPTIIRPDYWQDADFTYTFFDETRAFGIADTYLSQPSRLPNYFDLRVNRAKATELWPRGVGVTPAPDRVRLPSDETR